MNGRLDYAAFPLMIITAAVPNSPRPPFGVGFWDVGVLSGTWAGFKWLPPPLESPTYQRFPDRPPLVMHDST